jgi:hypothetical protein
MRVAILRLVRKDDNSTAVIQLLSLEVTPACYRIRRRSQVHVHPECGSKNWTTISAISGVVDVLEIETSKYFLPEMQVVETFDNCFATLILPAVSESYWSPPLVRATAVARLCT